MVMLLQLEDGIVTNKFQIDQQRTVIGRRVECDITIDDLSVSGQHAVFEMEDSVEFEGAHNFYIRDLNSTNGTFVNDKEVSRLKVENDDVIRVGWISFKVFDDNAKNYEKTNKIKKSWIPGVFYTK